MPATISTNNADLTTPINYWKFIARVGAKQLMQTSPSQYSVFRVSSVPELLFCLCVRLFMDTSAGGSVAFTLLATSAWSLGCDSSCVQGGGILVTFYNWEASVFKVLDKATEEYTIPTLFLYSFSFY